MDLTQAREKLDILDATLAKLFIQRMGIIEEIAKYKAGQGIAVHDPKREHDVILRLQDLTKEQYSEELEALYQSIFTISRGLQKKLGA